MKLSAEVKQKRLLQRLELPTMPFQSGYIYLIKCQNLYKIGSTKNPAKRLVNLQTSTPFPLELLHTIFCRDARTGESILHLRFKAKHVRGEWFELSKEDVRYILEITAL